MASLLALLLGTTELLALGETHAHEADKETRACTDVEQVFESIRTTTRGNAEVEDSGKEVTERVALLEDTRHQTTGLDGNGLESHGDGAAPDTAHSDTKEGANSEEGMVGGRVSSTELESTDDEPG